MRFIPATLSGKRLRPGGAGTVTSGSGMLSWLRRRQAANGEGLKLVPVAPNPRVSMRDWMDWALKHEPEIHYEQSRPIPLGAMKRRELPIRTDCSGSTTGCFFAAGLPDPNGKGYDGSGFTGTLRAHLPQRAHVADCAIGDPIVYGSGSGSHVVMVYTPGADPLVFSHGQERGPILVRHSVELAAHGGACTVHRAV